MNIDSIQTGIVIDHITAGKGMEIYNLLHLDKLDCSVALLLNASSNKMGCKDIIKINQDIDIDMNALGYVDPGATIVIIRNSKVVEKRTVSLPEKLTNVLKCKNPRCITTTEQELPHVFLLTEPSKRVYRCMYCETKANSK
ncbi:MAG: aspartate carbamoyltransferase regulatory subunit [Oscillospiraceae bacterium]|nr:aspartate carbamoyltransferase regulatory subunit [Oscillospiraceae bacterium]